MDMLAIGHASENDLQELGLHTRGDLLAVKAFCKQNLQQNLQQGADEGHRDKRKRKLLKQMMSSKTKRPKGGKDLVAVTNVPWAQVCSFIKNSQGAVWIASLFRGKREIYPGPLHERWRDSRN